MAKTLNRKGESNALPVDIKRPTKEFIDSVNQMTSSLQVLEEFQKKLRDLSPLDSARVDLTTVYAIVSLYWIYLVTKGENPRDHDVRKELDRLKEHMKRLKQMMATEAASQATNSSETVKEEAGPQLRVNKQAATRIVKHTIGKQGRSNEANDPPAKRGRKR